MKEIYISHCLIRTIECNSSTAEQSSWQYWNLIERSARREWMRKTHLKLASKRQKQSLWPRVWVEVTYVLNNTMIIPQRYVKYLICRNMDGWLFQRTCLEACTKGRWRKEKVCMELFNRYFLTVHGSIWGRGLSLTRFRNLAEFLQRNIIIVYKPSSARPGYLRYYSKWCMKMCEKINGSLRHY